MGIETIATALFPGVALLIEPIDFHVFPPSLVMKTLSFVAVTSWFEFSGFIEISFNVWTFESISAVVPSNFIRLRIGSPSFLSSKFSKSELKRIPFVVRKYQLS